MKKWSEFKPVFEIAEEGVRFRIVEDDGCYIILLPPVPLEYQRGPEEAEWKVATWITPEMWNALVNLPRPPGGLYEVARDGPMPPSWINKQVRDELKRRGIPPAIFACIVCGQENGTCEH